MVKKLPLGETLWNILKKSLKSVYDHMTLTVLISVLWSLATAAFIFVLILLLRTVLTPKFDLSTLMPLILVSLAGGVSIGGLVWGPLHCGLLSFARSVQENEGRWSGFWRGVFRNYGLAAKTYALFFFILIFLVLDILIAFTFTSDVMKIAGVSAMYFLIFLVLMSFYIPGLVVFQENNTVAKIIRKSYLLTLDNGLLNAAAGAILLALSLIMLVLPFYVPPLGVLFVLYFLAFGGFLHYFLTNLYHAVISRYED